MAKFTGVIPANPVKSFFVDMLTRDIDLQDAILDMLDNSVDGIQRTLSKSVLNAKQPYKGFWAKIQVDKDNFVIEDNCGGIPWKLHDYAFRMGRANRQIDAGIRTVGTYGIGMKRAIFKIGQECIITSHAKDISYQVRISSSWMKDEENWELKAEKIPVDKKRKGTKIEISQLHSGIKTDFSKENFLNSFREVVATNYAYIISKGFTVYVNDVSVKPKAIRLLFSGISNKKTVDTKIQPFIYTAEHNGVSIFLSVGFTLPIPSSHELEQGMENYKEQYSSSDAGWTVICNDRTILYCDKTAKTVWGVSGVPQYHTQFVSISGTVSFTSNDASLLPMNTTKRGVDMSSNLYLHVRDKMIEGTKIFTSYTNKWKGQDLVAKSREAFNQTPKVSVDEVIEGAKKIKMTSTTGVVSGFQYKPKLPVPAISNKKCRIVFEKEKSEVEKVEKYILGTDNESPSKVGEKCFDMMLEEAGE